MLSQLTEAMIVNGLIFMAITMILLRTAVLGVRASRLPGPALLPPELQEPVRRGSGHG